MKPRMEANGSAYAKPTARQAAKKTKTSAEVMRRRINSRIILFLRVLCVSVVKSVPATFLTPRAAGMVLPDI